MNLLIERGLKSEIEFYNISGSEKEIKQDLIKHCKYMGGDLREWMLQCNYNKLFGEVGINSLRAIENRHKINYLKRYMILDKEINRLLDDVEYQRSKLGRLTSSISETPRGGGSIYHDVNLEAINTIVNLEQQINHKIDQAIIYRQEIEAVIEKVEDDTERLN